MNHDQTFRVVLIAGWLILLPIAIYHRIQSQATGEKLDRRQEGLFILLTLRPLGIVNMLGLIAYMVHPSWMAWSSMPLPNWLWWTGVDIGVVAGAVFIWRLHTLGKNLTDTVVTRKKRSELQCRVKRRVSRSYLGEKASCPVPVRSIGIAKASQKLISLPFACGQRSVKAPSRRVFSEEGSEDREAKESGHVQNTRCGEEARKSGAVL